MKKYIKEGLQKAISYTSYRKLISDLIASGKSSGPIQSEDLLNYSKLNDRRMTRLDKTIQLSHETLLALKKNDIPITWLVLTEGWCGDAAQALPVINKIAKSLEINLQTFKEMKNKVIANVDSIEFAEKPSESSFGITDDMDDAEKMKILRKEYTKWNGQTNHKDVKKKKRAKEMVKIIADLRKQYSN